MAVVKNESLKKGTAFFVKNEKAIKLIAFLVFIGLTFVVGFFHEPWADEAQSWLIARDTGLGELFKVMAYEGSPALWQIILKIFIFCGLPYRFIFIIPFLFSAFGVWLLIYKSKLPLFFALILPFTYFLFYQYTAIARSYCLILPCIELIALAFPNRLQNPFLYGLSLILLSSICLHTALLSGVLFLFFCIDILISLKRHEGKIQIGNTVIAVCIVIFSYLSTLWYIRPPVDYSFPAHFNFSIKNILINFTNLFGNLFIYSAKTAVNLIVMVIMITTLILFYKISMRFILISSAVWVFLSLFYYNQWHIGIIFLSFILAFQLYPPKPRTKAAFIHKSKIYYKIMIGLFICVQLFWSTKSVVYDISHAYSGAYATAQFIKENHYDQQRIYGLGFNVTSIEPYFNANIYQNKGKNRAYYYWSSDNGDLTTDQVLADLPPIVVLADFDKGEFPGVEDALISLNYQVFEFDGASYIKKDIYESQKYFVYIRKDLVKDTV